MRSNRTLVGSSVVPFRLVFLMWLVFAADFLYAFDISSLGLLPRTTTGLVGIVVSPLIHGSLTHLISNTFPLLFLGAVLFYYYRHLASQVFSACYIVTNVLVWLLARPSYHIGASGLVYGLASFLIFYGLFKRDLKSLIISVVVIAIYGSIFYGVLPGNPGVSWESHLFGSLVGLGMAVSKKRS